MKIFKFILLISIGLTSCNPDKIDNSGVQNEIDRHKIKRITRQEIIDYTEKEGAQIVGKIQSQINVKVDSALKKGDFKAAMEYCNLDNYPSIKEMEKFYACTIERVGFENRLRNQSSKPDTMQANVLNEFAVGALKGKDIQVGNDIILYNQPITFSEQSCMRCHGTPGTEIKEEEYNIIKSKYPNDQSINFKNGQVAGLWTVRFDAVELRRVIK